MTGKDDSDKTASEIRKENDVLSDAARLAIIRYLRAILIPTGIAASIVAFLLGFFVNEVARSTAYTTALQGFASEIQAISADVGRAKGEAETAAREVELIVVQMRASKLEFEQLALDVKRKMELVTTAAGSLQEQLTILERNVTNQLKEVRRDVNGIEERVDRGLAIAVLQATGIDAILAGEIDSAERAFREAEGQIRAGLRESPKDLTLLNQQGYLYKNQAMVCLRSGRQDEAKDLLTQAENSFRRILDIDQKDPSALNGFGSVYFLRGDLDRAETYIRKALEIAPHYQAAQDDLKLIQRLRREKQPN